MNSAIKQATNTLHERLEAVPFNQKMFRGEQTIEERADYLCSMFEIFSVLDQHVPKEMRRSALIEKDLNVAVKPFSEAPRTTHGYVTYLERICSDVRPHIYLNYMGFMYGGQIMKKRYPTTSSMYEFENIEEQRLFVRQKYVEDHSAPNWLNFVSEVKHGFLWHIGISEELGEKFNVE